MKKVKYIKIHITLPFSELITSLETYVCCMISFLFKQLQVNPLLGIQHDRQKRRPYPNVSLESGIKDPNYLLLNHNSFV